MKRLLILIVGLLALAWLIYHCLHSRPPVIQEHVLACVSGKLAGTDYQDVQVAVDGRDVTLSGTVPTDGLSQSAAKLAADNCGARVVDNALQVRLPEPYITSLCVDNDGAHLTGSIGGSDVNEAVEQAARRRFHDDLEIELVIREDAPEGHAELLAPALYELSQLDSGCIAIEDNAVAVAGSIRSDEARERFISEFDEAAGSLFSTSYDLTVPALSQKAQLCQAFYEELLEPGERVLFDFDSSEIHDEGKALLDSVEEKEVECDGLFITVTGHTDSVGEPAYNRDLSMRRAQAVVDYLVSQGADAERLSAVGYGESQPRASNETDEGRAMNRRIEFRVREIN